MSQDVSPSHLTASRGETITNAEYNYANSLSRFRQKKKVPTGQRSPRFCPNQRDQSVRRRQRAGIATGVSPLRRYDADGPSAGAAARLRAQQAGPSPRDGGSVTSVANAHGFGSLSRFATEYQGALPRAAFRNAAPRRRWTLSYRVVTPRLSFFDWRPESFDVAIPDLQ
jgi:hypothetical protein